MLDSVWTLLNEAASRAQARVAVIAARRDVLMAETDLMWTLLGGEPEALVPLQSGESAASPKPGH
jgi:outer membrane protein TolC